MKFKMKITSCFIAFAILLLCSVPGNAAADAKEWQGTDNDGNVLTTEGLRKLLKVHEEWVKEFEKAGETIEALNNMKNDPRRLILKGPDYGRANLQGVDLRNANLKGASFQGLNFKEADLRGANFERASLFACNLNDTKLAGANFKGAGFQYTHLKNAELQNANFENAIIPETDFIEAKLGNAKFENAYLVEVAFQDAYLEKAKFKGANLWLANLKDAKLKDANFEGADLGVACIGGADFTNAHLEGANLDNVNKVEGPKKVINFTNAHLEGAILTNANLKGTILTEASLVGADLRGANLSEAKLKGTDLLNAKFSKVDLTGAQYEPVSAPHKGYLGGIELKDVWFQEEQQAGLVQLRNSFKEAGLRELEREATYYIEKGKTEYSTPFWRWFRLGFFEKTCSYGYDYTWPLIIFGSLICVFTIIYIFPIRWKDFPIRESKLTKSVYRIWSKESIYEIWSKGGIHKVWLKERVEDRECEWKNKPDRLIKKGLRAIGYAFYFSCLSAFHIGWRDLNVGNWIARMQPNEYTLRPTGWVRFVSGLQSLISIYLLALWVLIYFGRPFE